MKVQRFFYPWCLVICGVYLVSILHGNRNIYLYVVAFDSNRWLHFLSYVALIAVPTGLWRPYRTITLAYIPVMLGILIECLLAGHPWPVVRTQTIPADLFGFAAGILLGLNIRTMDNSTRSLKNANLHPHGPSSP